MGEINIKIDEFDPIDVLGVNNSKLSIIQKNYPKLKIIARGNQINVFGENEELNLFEQKIRKIFDHLNNSGPLTDGNLEEILKNENNNSVNNNTDKELLFYGPNGNAIKARTPNQQKMVDLSETNDIILAIGTAGTGKTYTAVAIAVKALKNKQVKRIILTRPAVEAGENLGFLPGDIREKIDPYLRPLYDALDDMIPQEKLKLYLENGTIEIAPLGFMRGRTLDNAYVILDEAQNTTHLQLKMFLTRMGPNAKFIVTGDVTQIDLPKNQQSGLLQAMNILKDIKGIDFIYLTIQDVVRHSLVKKIITAYEG